MDMEEKRIKYPIGVQTFRDIVEEGYLYIDKTGIIHELVETYSYMFLNRPRRFGKSLLSSTIHSYFSGDKELFEGLEVGKRKKEWTKHPVFHFDMSTAKHCSEAELLEELDKKLYNYEQTYGRDLHLYTLGYPNREVNIGFTQGLLAQYRSRSSQPQAGPTPSAGPRTGPTSSSSSSTALQKMP